MSGEGASSQKLLLREFNPPTIDRGLETQDHADVEFDTSVGELIVVELTHTGLLTWSLKELTSLKRNA